MSITTNSPMVGDCSAGAEANNVLIRRRSPLPNLSRATHVRAYTRFPNAALARIITTAALETAFGDERVLRQMDRELRWHVEADLRDVRRWPSGAV